jgi:cerevisin
LAWNGGGSSNYTEILASGGHKAGGASVEDSVKERVGSIIEGAEKAFHKELGAIYSEIKDAVSA